MAEFNDETELDNPVWSCLRTRHAHLAQGGPLALRYAAAFSPLSGMPASAAENVEALQNLFTAGEEFDVRGEFVCKTPPKWETRGRIRVVQMIRRDKAPLPVEGEPISVLGAADVADMLALVALTHVDRFASARSSSAPSSAFVFTGGCSRWPASACGSAITGK